MKVNHNFAFRKFRSYINSCTTANHIRVADMLVTAYGRAFPYETVHLTELQCCLQNRRVEVEYLDIIING